MQRHSILGSLLAILCGCTTKQVGTVIPAPLSVPGNVQLTTRLFEYDVAGRTIAQIERQILQFGPQTNGAHFAAVTRSSIKWTYKIEKRGDDCGMLDAHVTVDEGVYMPRLINVEAHDAIVVTWWHEHRSEIFEHEMGHVRIATNAGADIARRLKTLRDDDCKLLIARADSVAKSISGLERQQQAAYDRQSNHGAVQVKR